MNGAEHEATDQLVPPQEAGTRSEPRAALSLRPSNQRSGTFRFVRHGSAPPSYAGIARRGTNSRGSAGHLVHSVAARRRIRSPFLLSFFSPNAFLHRYGGALADAWYRSDDRHLFAGRSGLAARASSPPAGASCPDRLERR